MSLRYKRILLKLSGEVLMGEKGYGIDNTVLKLFSEEIKVCLQKGLQIALVIGGGNIFRGVSEAAKDMDRTQADYMGMLATLINSLALQNMLEKLGVHTRCQTAISMDEVAEPFILRKALRHLEKGRVVIFGAGTGNPYFTTDTAASLRAVEINADVLIKGTRVKGVYDGDPEKNNKAVFYEKISYMDVIKKDLKVMDLTAITLCRENKLPISVLDITKKGNILSFVEGNAVGSLVEA